MLGFRRAIRRSEILWAALFCVACSFSKGLVFGDNRESVFVRVSNSSLEPVFPTPLILLLNESAVASLRVQADNVSNSVSNTSLIDLYRDNDTQQLLVRYRERKRQERLLLIQRDILQKLGFSQQPNVTSGLSDEERQRMFQMFNRSYYTEHDTENEIQGTSLSEETNPS